MCIFATVLHDLVSWQGLWENITDLDILSKTGPCDIPKCYSILYNYAHKIYVTAFWDGSYIAQNIFPIVKRSVQTHVTL